MPRSRRWIETRGAAWRSGAGWRSEAGSASLEFVTAGMILLVPVVYLVLTVAAIQAGALAAEGAARQAARVFVQAESLGSAQASAIRAVEFALTDYGVDPDSADVAVSCRPDPDDCLSRQGFVTVTVDIRVALPLVPPVLGGDFPLAAPLNATATQQVSRFWGSG